MASMTTGVAAQVVSPDNLVLICQCNLALWGHSTNVSRSLFTWQVHKLAQVFPICQSIDILPAITELHLEWSFTADSPSLSSKCVMFESVIFLSEFNCDRRVRDGNFLCCYLFRACQSVSRSCYIIIICRFHSIGSLISIAC